MRWCTKCTQDHNIYSTLNIYEGAVKVFPIPGKVQRLGVRRLRIPKG